MNQKMLAVLFSVTQQQFNAVVRGREDAGKKLAAKMSTMLGGQIDVWMLKERRGDRKKIVDNYLDAVRVARGEN